MKTFVRLIKYIQPYRAGFTVALLLTLLMVMADLLIPWLFGLAVDRGLASRDLRVVAWYAVLLFGAQVVRSVVGYTQWMVQHRVGQGIVRDVRNELYSALQSLPQSFFRRMKTGDLMSRMTSDVEAIEEYLGWGFLIQIAAVVSFFATAGLLWVIDPGLTSVLLIPLLPLAAVVLYFNRRIGPAWEAIREQMGVLTTVLQENISGVRVVKAFARERHEGAKFAGRNDESRRLNLRRAAVEARSLPTMDLMIGLVYVLLAWAGARRVLAGDTSLGTFFAYQWYLWGMIWPVRFGGWIISMMREALSAGPRLFEIFDAPRPLRDSGGSVVLERARGEIRFENVSFAFADEPDREVLDGVDLDVAPGEVIAILGGTGSGKSTLVNLVPRFMDVSDGRVLIDGHDVRELTLDSLRRQIAVVPQESFLFSATVRDNIAYGRPDATDEEIEAAARQAQAHGFIRELDGGYGAYIGERGIGLSGGQKQRIALARAILMEPRILILDEATSAVDTETEHAIQRALEQVMAGRTSLVIAQRLSTIKHADRIVLLEAGRVVEEGTHEALLARDGAYARLYRMQFGNGTPETDPWDGGWEVTYAV